MKEEIILCFKCFLMFTVPSIYTYYQLKRDSVFRELSISPIWMASFLAGYAVLMMTCGREIGSTFFPSDFGKLLGRFILTPSGYLALVIAGGRHEVAPVLKMVYKAGLLTIQIILALKEVYAGQNDNLAFNALGIGVTLAIFDMTDTIKDGITESVENIIAHRELSQKEKYRKYRESKKNHH